MIFWLKGQRGAAGRHGEQGAKGKQVFKIYLFHTTMVSVHLRRIFYVSKSHFCRGHFFPLLQGEAGQVGSRGEMGGAGQKVVFARELPHDANKKKDRFPTFILCRALDLC